MTAVSETLRGFDAFRVTDWIVPSELGRARIDVIEASGTSAFLASLQGESIRDGDRMTRLSVGRRLVMSDTRDEYRDHVEAIHRATGRVLIHGLGLGCYLRAILQKPDVQHVDVVELEQDVLDLVGPYFADDARVHFHQGDAYTFTFPKGVTWDAAWHDIWADKCSDDLEGHARLNRRYARRVGWQRCWAHHELLRNRRWEKEQW